MGMECGCLGPKVVQEDPSQPTHSECLFILPEHPACANT